METSSVGMDKERPKVGVGVIVVKDGKILMGERIASHGANTWQIPGGHLEFGETFEETAMREVAEETGITDIEIEGLVSVSNERDYGKHYANISMLAKWKSGEPRDAEPEKSRNWQWIDPTSLPEPMFISSKKVVENWLARTIYSDCNP